MARYRKLPVLVDAIQFTGTKENHDEISRFCPNSSFISGLLLIKTLEGFVIADVNDWIIRGVAGEYYPCKPGIFEMTYEPAQPLKEG